MPTIEEIATQLSGVHIFTVGDAKNGFGQVELDNEATFNTPFGCYRWKRMPFGVSSAPEVGQRKMHETIKGLEDGTEVIADDFLFTGKDDAERYEDVREIWFSMRKSYMKWGVC